MKPYLSIAVLLFVCTSRVAQGQPRDTANGDSQGIGGVSITALGRPAVTEGRLSWLFQIRNDQSQDIWVCDAMDGLAPYEAYLAEDNKTLCIRRRLDLPTTLPASPRGLYVRLRAGEARTELASFPLPMIPHYLLQADRTDQPPEFATRVVLEIGYYVGDLPATVLDLLCKADQAMAVKPFDSSPELRNIHKHFGGTLFFLLCNENSFYTDRMLDRSDWVEIAYTHQELLGEHLLRLEAEELHIPYLEQEERAAPRPDLTQCTRIETRFQTSGLGFFFPHLDEQSLLSDSEKEYVQSLDNVVIADDKRVKELAGDVARGVRDGFVSNHGIAELACYQGDQLVLSLAGYDCSYIINENGQVFRYEDRLPALRKLTPRIEGLDLRAQCATHLEDLWYRFAAYYKRTGAYPTAKRWADDIVKFLRAGNPPGKGAWRDDWIMPAFQCPSTDKGRCHYAMNANCTGDSPGNTVLLFETKPGWMRRRWNQHGGPELFTFDNHNPRGGCVLFNDGTVKFIRTEEELRQLRWK
jgi:hypothetical protein